MKTRKPILLFLLLLALFNPPAAIAAPVVLDEGVDKYPLGLHLEILKDKDGKLALDDVVTPEWQEKFTPSDKKIPNFGFTSSAYWARFSLKNPLDKEQCVLLEQAYPHIDSIKVYIFRNAKKVASLQGGDWLPFAENGLVYRNYVFNLPLPPQSETIIYMRFQTESSMQLPLTVWRPTALAEKINKEETILGFYFGIMGAMLLYNLFLFIFLRDRNYLYYILYIASFTMAQLGVNRFDIEYLWPNSPAFANLSHPVFFNLTFFFGGLFCRSFLGTKKLVPIIDKAILAVMGVCLLGVALTFISGYTAGILCVVYVIALLGPIFMLSAGISSWIKGLTIARYYTIAWSVFLTGAIVFNLRNIGVLPSVPLIDFSPHIGSAIEVVFLSLALADRINIIRNEKLAAQAKAIAAEKALTEALEKQVEERTSHIQRLSGLLPICASCKKIRDDKGYWQQVEEYVQEHSEAEFSHSICPECMKKLYPEVADKVLRGKDSSKEM